MAIWTSHARTAKGHRSLFEDIIDEQLKRSGVSYDYESETIPWTDKVSSGVCFKCGHPEVGQRRNYTPDFRIAFNDERGRCVRQFFIEVKGRLTSEDRRKLRGVKKQYPELDLRLLFQKDNVIPGTKEKTRYSAWATKFGFKWSVGEVPKHWLK